MQVSEPDISVPSPARCDTGPRVPSVQKLDCHLGLSVGTEQGTNVHKLPFMILL